MIIVDDYFNFEDLFIKCLDKCIDIVMCFNKRIYLFKNLFLENYRYVEKNF